MSDTEILKIVLIGHGIGLLIAMWLKRRKRNLQSRRVCAVCDKELKKLGYEEK